MAKRNVRWGEYTMKCDKCDINIPASNFGLTLARMHMGQTASRGDEHVVMVTHNYEGPICAAKYF